MDNPFTKRLRCTCPNGEIYFVGDQNATECDKTKCVDGITNEYSDCVDYEFYEKLALKKTVTCNDGSGHSCACWHNYA